MSLRTIAVRTLAVAGLAFATAAAADSGDRRLYVAPMASYLSADAERGTDDGLGFTLSLGKKVASGLNLELTGFLVQMDGDDSLATNGSSNATLKGFGAGAMIFPLGDFPEVFGVLAVQYGGAEKHPGVISDYKSTIFDTGVGYLLPLTWIGVDFDLRAELRYRMDSHSRPQVGKGGDKHFYDGVLNIGAQIPLGPKPASETDEEEVVEVVELSPADSDGDGIPDDTDQCPETVAGAIVDDKGCEKDEDGDGVVDRLDKCPGTPPGVKVDETGCAVPEPVPPPVDTGCREPKPGEPITLEGCAAGDAIILRGVNFNYDKSNLTVNAKVLLDGVADALLAVPNIKVEIGGHTDAKGTDAYNQKLSEKRAVAVVDYLAARGVPADRLSSKGYGESQPIDSNETEEGRELNRRVELKIVE